MEQMKKDRNMFFGIIIVLLFASYGFVRFIYIILKALWSLL
jgi:hypothetical protein